MHPGKKVIFLEASYQDCNPGRQPSGQEQKQIVLHPENSYPDFDSTPIHLHQLREIPNEAKPWSHQKG